MDCHLNWSTSNVEHGKLRVSLEPAPDFAFMMEFDRIVDPLSHPQDEGWGGVLLAHGHVVVSDVRLESAQQLRTFLDETVREANRLAVETREREKQQETAQAARSPNGKQAVGRREGRGRARRATERCVPAVGVKPFA